MPNTTSTCGARSRTQLAVLLGEAAADRDLQVGPLLLQRLQVAEVAVELVVGVLPDAAGVEHDDVGRVEVVGRLHALGREQSGDPLGVVLVHLAPVGAHEEAPGHDPPSVRRADLRPNLRPSRSSPRHPDRTQVRGEVRQASTSTFVFGVVVGGRGRPRPRSMPLSTLIFSLISTMRSTFSARNFFTFSRPWPSCSPS